MKTSHIAMAAALAAAPALAQDLPQAGNEWFTAGQEALRAKMGVEPVTTPAKNVIILISDGNGVGTNYATRLYEGQEAGGFGDEHVLHHESFPHLALSKTYNVNAQTPDSAGTGTAMHSGVKTKAGVLGVDETLDRGDCSQVEGASVATASEVFTEMGKSVGLVSTARITHATPASVYAHAADRNFEADADLPEGCDVPDIATQLIDAMEEGRVDVAMGGGRRNFYPEGADVPEGGEGSRIEGDLVARAEGLDAQTAFDDESFASIDVSTGGPILGLFEDSHMQYEHDRSGEPSLAEMTAAAIEALSGNEEGFFLSVEAGRVDHANHAGNLHRVVTDGQAFAEAVRTADEMTDDGETLIVVTADHEHAIAFNGYCGRGSPITGLCYQIDEAGTMHADSLNMANDDKPYSVVGYLNGVGSVLLSDQGYSGERPSIEPEEATDPEYLQQALIPMDSETHSGEDVAIYAKGPFAHLLDGTVEQHFIFHVMHHAATAEGEVQASGDEVRTADDVLPIADEAQEDVDESMVDEGEDAATE